MLKYGLSGAETVDDTLCGLTIHDDKNDAYIIFVRDTDGLDDKCVFTILHEIAHVYTMYVSDTISSYNKANQGYLFWREFIADHIAIKCFSSACSLSPENVLHSRFLKFIDYGDRYSLCELIAAVVFYDVQSLAEEASIPESEENEDYIMEMSGCIMELAYMCKKTLQVERAKTPYSMFEEINSAYKAVMLAF